MTKFLAIGVAALSVISALPVNAQGLQAPPNLPPDQLVAWAAQSGVCGDQPLVDAQYEGRRQVKIVCGEATGFVPVVAAGVLGAGGAGLAIVAGGGLALAALAAGGGNSTNNTR